MENSVSSVEEEILERARRAAQALSQDRNVRVVFLFSAANPEQGNPVCLGVFTDLIDTEDEQRLCADATLAAGEEINLVWLLRATPSLAKEIGERGICLYSSTPEGRMEYVCFAQSVYWDWQAFLERQQRMSEEGL